MPPIAILSDVHGNLHALDAVREQMEARAIGEWWCLGDMVGYGAFPRETLAACTGGARRCIVGNHDMGACGRADLALFSDTAATALTWTHRELDTVGREVLHRLQPQDVADDVSLYHGSPRDPVWEYILSPRQAELALVTATSPLTFVGHTHLPGIWQWSGAEGLRAHPVDAPPIAVDQGRWLVNPGSVGQPRDHDPRASWAILDTDAHTVEVVRTPYDVAAAQRAIRRAGLPRILADRLEQGR